MNWEELQRVKLIIEYDGSAFSGWQRQPDQKTVQGECERHLQTIFQHPIPVHGSGRTDAGVHARGQVAHLDLPKNTNLGALKQSLNKLLTGEAVIHTITPMDDAFDSRFHATYRRYRYHISEQPRAIHRQFLYTVGRHLNIDRLNGYASVLIGDHDFTTFSKLHSDVKNYRSVVYQAQWVRETGILIFEIKAIRFLRGMVRSLVGTQLYLERSTADETEMHRRLKALDRALGKHHAPASGLVLEEVGYDLIVDTGSHPYIPQPSK